VAFCLHDISVAPYCC